jgi:hypothetical protein
MKATAAKQRKSDPRQPTQALPGSREKRAVLAQRAQRGEALFDADDTAWKETALVAWLKEPGGLRMALLRRLGA